MRETTTGLYPRGILIVGAKGFLGRHFFAYLRSHPHVVATHHQSEPGMVHLNLFSPKVPEGQFEVAFICAGLGTPYRCKNDPEQCYQADVIGISEICRILHDRGTRPVIFSSSYAQDPKDTYGWQKWELEQKVKDFSTVIRIGKLLGTSMGDKTLFDEIAHKLFQQQTVTAAVDQYLNLVDVQEVIKWALDVAAEPCQRFNFFSASQVSRYDAACFLAEAMGYTKELIIPVTLAQLGLTLQSHALDVSDRPFSSWQQGALAMAQAYRLCEHALG